MLLTTPLNNIDELSVLAEQEREGVCSMDAEKSNAANLEAGRLLFTQHCTFMLGAPSMADLPQPSLPEVAFAGRSNVGKSSLINALTNRKSIARTSNTPGRTQEVNFFDLGERLCLVDLPGYGYARVSRSRVKQWTGLIMNYLKGRAVLRRVCLLIDGRRGIMDSDEEVMKTLDDAAVAYQIVVTKWDKVKPGKRDAVQSTIRGQIAPHVAAHPQQIWTSSITGEGMPELRAALATLAISAP